MLFNTKVKNIIYIQLINFYKSRQGNKKTHPRPLPQVRFLGLYKLSNFAKFYSSSIFTIIIGVLLTSFLMLLRKILRTHPSILSDDN